MRITAGPSPQLQVATARPFTRMSARVPVPRNAADAGESRERGGVNHTRSAALAASPTETAERDRKPRRSNSRSTSAAERAFGASTTRRASITLGNLGLVLGKVK